MSKPKREGMREREREREREDVRYVDSSGCSLWRLEHFIAVKIKH